MVPEGGRHPDSRKGVFLRGAALERGSRSVPRATGGIQPVARRIGDFQGCSRSSSEEGPYRISCCGQQGVIRVGLCSKLRGPQQLSALFQTATRRKRWLEWGIAASDVALGREFLGNGRGSNLCVLRRPTQEEVRWLVFFRGPSSRGEGRFTLGEPERRRFGVVDLLRRRSKKARNGRSGVCPCVESEVCRSR